MSLERLKEIAQITYKDYATTKDVAAFFKQLMASVQETRKALHDDIKARLAEIRQPADGRDGRNPLTVSKRAPENPQTGDLWYQP